MYIFVLIELLYTHFSDEDKLKSNQLLVLTMTRVCYFDLTLKLIEVGVPITLVDILFGINQTFHAHL